MDTTTKNLRKKVGQRKKIIVEIVRFVEAFATKEGKRIKYEQGSSNTHIVYEFKDFAGFDMLFSDGETMFGGTSVKLMLNSLVVFYIYYQIGLEDDCTVYVFSEETKWLPAFRSAVKNKENILKQKTLQKTKKVIACKQSSEKEKKEQALLKEAKRLKVSV